MVSDMGDFEIKVDDNNSVKSQSLSSSNEDSERKCANNKNQKQVNLGQKNKHSNITESWNIKNNASRNLMTNQIEDIGKRKTCGIDQVNQLLQVPCVRKASSLQRRNTERSKTLTSIIASRKIHKSSRGSSRHFSAKKLNEQDQIDEVPDYESDMEPIVESYNHEKDQNRFAKTRPTQ